MIYCVSDIHGCYPEFMQLLTEIKFGNQDILYVLGDIIDRGEASLECLEYVASKDNIICIMGNHEMLALDFFF